MDSELGRFFFYIVVPLACMPRKFEKKVAGCHWPEARRRHSRRQRHAVTALADSLPAAATSRGPFQVRRRESRALAWEEKERGLKRCGAPRLAEALFGLDFNCSNVVLLGAVRRSCHVRAGAFVLLLGGTDELAGGAR